MWAKNDRHFSTRRWDKSGQSLGFVPGQDSLIYYVYKVCPCL
nr:MAG TPA: hypothetical protein [Caudoviricetes sp.]